MIQLRTNDPTPETMAQFVLSALKQFHDELLQGALITIDPAKSRARVLPIKSHED